MVVVVVLVVVVELVVEAGGEAGAVVGGGAAGEGVEGDAASAAAVDVVPSDKPVAVLSRSVAFSRPVVPAIPALGAGLGTD